MTRCALLVVAMLTVLAISASASLVKAGSNENLLALDDDQRLVTADAAREFREKGQTSVAIESIQLEVTVADDPGAVNATGWQLGNLRRYVRVDYAEDVPRDVRLHVHEDIIIPRPSKGATPIGADGPPADFVAPADGHQSVTLHLRGETHAVYVLSDINGELWSMRTWASSVWSNSTGVSIPSLGGGEWQYVPGDALEGTSPTYKIPDSDTVQSLTVQYDDGGAWLSVPECQADAPVCLLERNNSTVLFGADADPPPVRYKLKRDAIAGLRSAWDDLASIPGDIADALGGLFGGGSS